MQPFSKEDNGGDFPKPWVRTVGLHDFRNYADQRVELGEGFNVISGENAQGKTNFLESLYMVSTTRLLRGMRDSEAIRDSAERAAISVLMEPSGTELRIELERGSRKRGLLNGLALPRASDLIGRLRCVCISSADMEIVRSEPAERRLFLDLELSAMSPGYLRHLSHYKRATDQRNALLKQAREGQVPDEAFEVWEDQMALHGSELRKDRIAFTESLLPFAQAAHDKLGSSERLQFEYRPQDEALDYPSLGQGLIQSRAIDVKRGSTSIGPHRDDLEILIEGRSARLFGSQGQQRTAVISLKLATLSLSSDRDGWPPLLLLDDILSDLDEGRRLRLVEIVLVQAGQAVLTCTEESAAGDAILTRAKVFKVKQGSIQEA
jgi:DNA replication and repair protein RecF